MAERRTVDLPRDHVAFVDAQISSGAYASESDVIGAALDAMQDHERTLERWLREEVAATYDEAKANPDASIPAEVVFAELRARHAARFKV